MICHPNPSQDHFFPGRRACNNLLHTISHLLAVLSGTFSVLLQDFKPQTLIEHNTLLLIFWQQLGAQLVEQDPDMENSRSHTQKLCGLRIFRGLMATNTSLYGGVAEKGSSNTRKSDLVMNYVWEQSKSNVFNVFTDFGCVLEITV